MLLDAPSVLCYGGLEKLLYDIKSVHFHIFKSLTFQGVLNLEDEEEVAWVHVWGVGVDASVKCGVWLKIEPSMAVHRTHH